MEGEISAKKTLSLAGVEDTIGVVYEGTNLIGNL
jgi:hypothetical protein